MDGKSNDQIVFIDILKSIACLCVVVGHVLMGMIKAGMEIHWVLYHICTFLYLFHVPCFFFASGYLYGKNTIDKPNQYVRFILKKLIVLGLPYLACSVAYVLFSSFLRGEMNASYSIYDIFDIWKEPIAQYWYLYALFEFFLLIPVIEFIFKKINKIVILLLLTALGIFIHPNLVCVSYVTAYSYIFYTGVYFYKTDLLDKSGIRKISPVYLFSCCCIGSAVVYGIYAIFFADNNAGILGNAMVTCIVKLILVLLMVGISLALERMNHLLKRFLVWLSKYSLYVYLFHTWFSGTTRIVLRRVGVTNCWIQTVCGIVTGLAGSIIAAVVVQKTPVLRIWFEPLKVLEKQGCRYFAQSSECKKIDK
jgi:fucose 4-O-acetylase-like acetyltransferase